uniref:Uncharacterized protein n=1 Tax=Romanomermis culicivorax TaxID=13658 RepID=A0A915IBE4_ROMCU
MLKESQLLYVDCMILDDGFTCGCRLLTKICLLRFKPSVFTECVRMLTITLRRLFCKRSALNHQIDLLDNYSANKYLIITQ